MIDLRPQRADDTPPCEPVADTDLLRATGR